VDRADLDHLPHRVKIPDCGEVSGERDDEAVRNRQPPAQQRTERARLAAARAGDGLHQGREHSFRLSTNY
jgi:hypothetical protein